MSKCATCGKELPSWKRVLESGLCAECAARETKQRKETRRSKQNTSAKVLAVVLMLTVGAIGVYARHQRRMRMWRVRDAQRKQFQQHPPEQGIRPGVQDWPKGLARRDFQRRLRDAGKQPQPQQRPPWPRSQPQGPWPPWDIPDQEEAFRPPWDLAASGAAPSDSPPGPLPAPDKPGAGPPLTQEARAELIKEELNKLAGTWQCVFAVEDGEKVPEAEVKRLVAVQDAEGNYKLLLEGEVVAQGTYTEVDPTKIPKTVDGEDDEGKFAGIYRTDGDTLEQCSADTDQPRPTEFTSKPGSGHTYEVWKRVVPVEGMEAIAGRPSARRVARRAMVLALVTYRASLEEFPGEASAEALHRRLPTWIGRLNLGLELEKQEHDYLRVPLGKADDEVDANASWRGEGLGVLAWALKRYELPRHDEVVDGRKAIASVGFTEERLARMDTTAAEKLLRDAQLRPASEIDRFASHITIVNWRLRGFRLAELSPTPIEPADPEEYPFGRGIGERMDFVGFLRAHPSFQKTWLKGLRLVGGELAVGETSIDAAPPEDVRKCASIAVERQTAAYWLQGDDPIYSDVDPATLLSPLADEAKAADTRKALKQKLWEKHIAEAEEAYNRGVEHLEQGEHEKAIAEFTEAIRLLPAFGEAYGSLAWLRATCPKAEFRDGKQALEYAQKARELSAPEEPVRLQTLAAAYAELGQFDEAVKWLKKALESPDDLSQEGLKKARLQLELYEQRKPYRDE